MLKVNMISIKIIKLYIMKKSDLLSHFDLDPKQYNTDLVALLVHLETENEYYSQLIVEHDRQIYAAWDLAYSIFSIPDDDIEYYRVFRIMFPGQHFNVSKSVLDLFEGCNRNTKRGDLFYYFHQTDLMMDQLLGLKTDKSGDQDFISWIDEEDKNRLVEKLWLL